MEIYKNHRIKILGLALSLCAFAIAPVIAQAYTYQRSPSEAGTFYTNEVSISYALTPQEISNLDWVDVYAQPISNTLPMPSCPTVSMSDWDTCSIGFLQLNESNRINILTWERSIGTSTTALNISTILQSPFTSVSAQIICWDSNQPYDDCKGRITVDTNQFTVLDPTCSDGIQNQDEAGVDCEGVCGGTCQVCWDGSKNVSCPTCSDGIQNQDETDIDINGVCSNCTDGIQNQDETEADRGGVCGMSFSICDNIDPVEFLMAKIADLFQTSGMWQLVTLVLGIPFAFVLLAKTNLFINEKKGGKKNKKRSE